MRRIRIAAASVMVAAGLIGVVAAPVSGGGGTPPSEFSFGKVNKNKKRGTAKLTVEVPAPGELDLAKTKKVKADEGAITPGGAFVSIKPRGKAKEKLNNEGEAKVKAIVTYTRTGGSPNTKDKKIKLVKR